MEVPGEYPVRRFAETINAGDLQGAIDVCHPEIEFLSVLAASGRRYYGHSGIRE